ncbi:hypothetical protein [Plebeiibacterium sediminum]|uniref:Uncharacterized protein n=1 Tax=Plebeiibacterium sediminum TaxID=2992112 RepID=A0AAE3M3B1_9BACT|nr:hypothetical protein [Plebeiobacterium sediminum]MCW3786446.1 hypothetical protein [Plebeiobacterium sediminum]
MKKINILITLLVLIQPIFSQNKLNTSANNALLPNSLLLETLCPLDTNFSKSNSLGNDLYYSIIDYTGGKLPHQFTEIAFNSKNHKYTLEPSNYYPYDFTSYTSLNEDEVKISFGESKETVVSGGKNIEVITPLNPIEIKAVQFIESWNLNTQANTFDKTIKAIIPIRSLINYSGSIQKQTCIIEQTPDKDIKNERLIAKVKYEVLLFNKNEFKGDEDEYDLFKKELSNAPLLTSYARYQLIGFIETSAHQKIINAYDFNTNKPIEDIKSIKQMLGYTSTVLNVIDTSTGEVVEKIIEDRTASVKSIIFCEEWYTNKDKSSIHKKVVGIAPVTWKENSLEKNTGFTLWFDEAKVF